MFSKNRRNCLSGCVNTTQYDTASPSQSHMHSINMHIDFLFLPRQEIQIEATKNCYCGFGWQLIKLERIKSVVQVK